MSFFQLIRISRIIKKHFKNGKFMYFQSFNFFGILHFYADFLSCYFRLNASDNFIS